MFPRSCRGRYRRVVTRSSVATAGPARRRRRVPVGLGRAGVRGRGILCARRACREAGGFPATGGGAAHSWNAGDARVRRRAGRRATGRPGSAVGAAGAASAAPPTRLFGATTTYYALQPDGFGASLVRFNTDGKAHVSRRTVLTPADPGTVIAPTSSIGGTLVAMEAGHVRPERRVGGLAGPAQAADDGRVLVLRAADASAAGRVRDADRFRRGERAGAGRPVRPRASHDLPGTGPGRRPVPARPLPQRTDRVPGPQRLRQARAAAVVAADDRRGVRADQEPRAAGAELRGVGGDQPERARPRDGRLPGGGQRLRPSGSATAPRRTSWVSRRGRRDAWRGYRTRSSCSAGAAPGWWSGRTIGWCR